MVFSSLTFLFIFLPVVLLAYYICRDISWKNVILLIASLLFYAWGEPVYIILMIISIAFNFFIGEDIERRKNKKPALILGIIVNLLILGYFKYSGLIVDTINSMTGLAIKNKELPLPIGISFYTFQAMSYIIDVYRGNSKAQKNIVPFAVYITMFPQLIAGPIVKYGDIEKQLTMRRFSARDMEKGIVIFVRGLAKKVILANVIAGLNTAAVGMTDRSVLTAWLGAIAYTLQIFNDFSGYSDMAIGLGKMHGFQFPKNFDAPYRSTSITEFWRRWHISLGSWFREYLYIPLGGNRKGTARQILNLLIVWMLTGLWHGAAWNFVAWGLYYGILLILEKFVFKNVKEKLPKFVNWLITFILVVIGWVLFFSESLPDAVRYLGTMFGSSGKFVDRTGGFYLAGYGIIMIIGFMTAFVETDDNRKKRITWLDWLTCVLMAVLSIAFLVSETYNPFLYFRF